MRKVLAVLVACLAVLGGPVAHAADQLRANEPPTVEGEFYEEPEQQCDEQTLKSDGKPVIKVAFCIFFFQFNSLFEIDLSNDYGVVWAQATFDALPGLCTSEVSFYVEVSPGTEIYGRTPQDPVKARKAGPVAVELPATANGTAIQPGLVTQEFQLLPGKMSPTGLDEESRAGVSWKGRSAGKLAFATGAEIGWPALESPEMRLGADTIRLTSGKGC